MKLSPIILFAYKRPNELLKVLEALGKNPLSIQSELYIFIDGPKKEDDIPKVEEVRKICDAITGFKKIHKKYHELNQGCANSIIDGISYVLKRHKTAIIIEDDILTSTNFLNYMNQCLNFYKSDSKVFSISGFSLPFKLPSGYLYDVFSFPRTCSWGWGTWADRWFSVDWEVTDYKEFIKNSEAKKNFNFGGSDLVKMLKDFMNGKIDTWDISFCFSQFKQNGLTIYPTISKVENIGFYGTDATHTQVYNRYKVKIGNGEKNTFRFPTNLTLVKNFTDQFQRHYSIPVRILNRLRTILGMR
jgi:hypothetical protein